MSAREAARTLRATGLTQVEVARQLGVSRSTVAVWEDPDNLAKQRERRKRYQRPCPSCGKLMDGSGGYKTVPSLCTACFHRMQHNERRWTQEAIVGAIKGWAELYGRRPWSSEWLVSPGPDWPCAATVIAECGSWANAVEAAGFERPRVGGYPRNGSKGAPDRPHPCLANP